MCPDNHMPIDSELDAVRRPITEANGLSNAHYTDPATHELERDKVLFASWSGLATASDVPEPGDALPLEFLGVPLLLMRGKDGDVRVFQNICRHRGMILVSEPRKIEGAIRCPYHSWCYNHKGGLVSTPHVGGPGTNIDPAIDRDTLGLVEVRSHVWRDIVFININGNAPAFEQAMAPALSRWAEFEQPLYHGGDDSRFDLTVNCNWKLAVENYCESYHLPWIHPGLNTYSRLEDHYHIEEPDCFSGQGTEVYRQLQGDKGEVFPDFKDLSEKWDTAAEYVAIYPNVLLGTHRDHAFVIILVPDAQDRTTEKVHIYYPTPDTDVDLRVKNTEQWREVFIEDVFVVEGMQKGRMAPGFDGGRFSPVMDGPTHMFHAWVAGKIADGSP